MLFTCKCCEISQDFIDEENFEKEDWERIAPVEDEENNITTEEEIFCNLCPSFYVSDVAFENHDAVHNSWNSMGRPESFSVGTCLLNEDRLKVTKIQELLGASIFNGTSISEKKLVSSTLTSIHFGDTKIKSILNSWVNRPLADSIW